MTTVVVSIGGSVQGVPMGDNVWSDFKSDLVDFMALGQVIDTTYFQGEGLGYYEGSVERSFTYIGEATTGRIAHLEYGLRRLARAYLQDSIAFTLGETEFAYGCNHVYLSPGDVCSACKATLP